MLQKLELLSPARNIETGIEAINHGADAVYIGGPNFGARASASNSIEDIKILCDHAHIYGARVYVTLNTILYENELKATEELIHKLYHVGVDAIIVQDLAITQMDLPPIEIHASTQMDISSTSRAIELNEMGFKQIVVARELNVNQINEIHDACPNVKIEAFIHGALCVSYSGRCYASQHCFGRSANRGECAQFCRLPFDLIDSENKPIVKSKHLLSLRDMNRSEHLEDLIKAGVSSFKIEGRLKDMSYVKNVTSYYSQLLNDIIAKSPDKYCRASKGKCSYKFNPQLDKSFNRGFTSYFLDNKPSTLSSMISPKSMGEYVGKIVQFTPLSLIVKLSNNIKLNAGDGLCFIDFEEKLIGFRANSVLKTGVGGEYKILFGPNAPIWAAIYSKIKKPIHHDIQLYRNHDLQFEKDLSQTSASRKLLVSFRIFLKNEGIYLSAIDELNRASEVLVTSDLIAAKTPQEENIIRQLSKLGETPYAIQNIDIDKDITNLFIPSSLLANSKRLVIEQLLSGINPNALCQPTTFNIQANPKNAGSGLSYTANVSNSKAKAVYQKLGYAHIDPAYEIEPQSKDSAIMFCKYCIKRQINLCSKTAPKPNGTSFKEPFYLKSVDGRKFKLSFDCKNCIMKVYPTS